MDTCALQVRLCREKKSGNIYAMKKLKKSEMLIKGQVRRGILPPLFFWVVIIHLVLAIFLLLFSRVCYYDAKKPQSWKLTAYTHWHTTGDGDILPSCLAQFSLYPAALTFYLCFLCPLFLNFISISFSTCSLFFFFLSLGRMGGMAMGCLWVIEEHFQRILHFDCNDLNIWCTTRIK